MKSFRLTPTVAFVLAATITLTAYVVYSTYQSFPTARMATEFVLLLLLGAGIVGTFAAHLTASYNEWREQKSDN